MGLSEILSNVACTPPKSRNGVPSTQKNLKHCFDARKRSLISLEPMERKKRRKTMVSLPCSPKLDSHGEQKNKKNTDSPSVSLRFLAKHIIDPNKENYENEKENIFHPNNCPKTPTHNQNNISLLKK